ncbi:hydroxymethylbilane synthase [Patulibacter americanus]|uniref:hydroxymethylbilane synthase n=1 Tax=Patulibacter americanus TaxID=588672 RepID=UPI0003B6B2F9|nr:hydroxymethylbilane synthase [Patulibacter americanus]
MIRLGSRRSPLALVQAHAVAGALRAAGHDVEIVEVVTTGDRDRAAPDKAKWVTELERGLVEGTIDLAVHSAKDVPGDIPDSLALVAATEREDPRDVLIGARSLEDLPEGARVGTASLRRAAQLLATRPDLDVVEIRGNVDTRLGRLSSAVPAHADPVDAIVLAAAGLHRLGREPEGVSPLIGPAFVSAPGQGTLALEARADDPAIAEAVRAVHHEDSWVALLAERAVSGALGADCTSAVGAHCRRIGDGLTLEGFVGAPDGSGWVVDIQEGSEPEALGALVAERLRRAGADELLDAARAESDIPPGPEPHREDRPE